MSPAALRRLETCPECRGVALPECLVCGSRAIIRLGAATSCQACGETTVCPFEERPDHDEEQGDGVAC